MSTELAARARDVGVEILRTCDGTEPLHELIALGYLQGRIEAAMEMRRAQQEPAS
jgi:hypothetical protein